MAQVTTEDVQKEVEKVDEYMAEEVVDEAAVHIKMELVSQMSAVTLNLQSGLHSQTRKNITEEPVPTKFLVNKKMRHHLRQC